jgi:hypothetical protein
MQRPSTILALSINETDASGIAVRLGTTGQSWQIEGKTRNGILCALIWPLRVNWRKRNTRGSALGFPSQGLRVDRNSHQKGNATHGMALATIDHADIRGLVTAFHLSVAGLPRSKVGDYPKDAHMTCSWIPHIVSRASRSYSSVLRLARN